MDIPPPSGPQQPWQGGPPQSGPQDPYAPPPGGLPGPGGPYQPWPGGYSPYSQPPVNGLAIASLVLGILCFVPALGLILGIVALSQIRKRGERGQGLAVGGIVMSSIGLVLVLLVVLGSVVDGFDDASGGSGSPHGPGSSDVTFSLDVGECFDDPGGSLEGLTYDVDRVSCTGRHDGEVFANFAVPGGSWPGDKSLSKAADDKCSDLADGYAMDTWALPEEADIYYYTPTEESWDLGDHEITCMFGNTDGTAYLTGSLRNDEGDLDPGQVAYLKAAKPAADAMLSAPDEEYVEDDLAGHKRWAQRVGAALRDQERQLAQHTWRGKAAAAVAAEITLIGDARKEWDKAAVATDADTYYEHYAAAEDLLSDADRIPARKALGLDTTPPQEESAEDDGSGGTDSGGSGSDSGGSGAAV